MLTLAPSSTFAAPTNSATPAPTPASPLPNSVKESPESFSAASARIFTASASRTSPAAVFITSPFLVLPPNRFKKLNFFPALSPVGEAFRILVNPSRPFIITVISPPIAATDFARSRTFNLLSFSTARVSIPTAAAIISRFFAFTLSAIACSLSVRQSAISVRFVLIQPVLSSPFSRSSKKFFIPFAASNKFFPAHIVNKPPRVSKMVFREICSVMLSKKGFTLSQTAPSPFFRALAIPPRIPANPPAWLTASSTNPEIPPKTVWKSSPRLFPVNRVFSSVRASPTLAKLSSNKPPRLRIPLLPIKLPTASLALVSTLRNISRTENTPLNPRFSLSVLSSLNFSPAVKFFNVLVIRSNRSAVVGGNNSENASFTVAAIPATASHKFHKLSIKSLRPPAAFHSVSKSF